MHIISTFYKHICVQFCVISDTDYSYNTKINIEEESSIYVMLILCGIKREEFQWWLSCESWIFMKKDQELLENDPLFG